MGTMLTYACICAAAILGAQGAVPVRHARRHARGVPAESARAGGGGAPRAVAGADRAGCHPDPDPDPDPDGFLRRQPKRPTAASCIAGCRSGAYVKSGFCGCARHHAPRGTGDGCLRKACAEGHVGRAARLARLTGSADCATGAAALAHSKFTLTWWASFKACLRRELMLMICNKVVRAPGVRLWTLLLCSLTIQGDHSAILANSC